MGEEEEEGCWGDSGYGLNFSVFWGGGKRSRGSE